jgi:sporulation protein YlmC with PRC-barrel domain
LVTVLVSVESLVGKKVITAKAYILGEVKGAEADINNWRITHLQVKLTDKAATDLGFKKRFRSSTICMPVSLISAVGEVVTIEKSLDELSKTFDIVECKE